MGEYIKDERVKVLTTLKSLHGHFGVLTSKKAMKAFAEKKPHYRLKQLALANKKVNLNLYFFSVDMIDLKNKRIKGYYYDFSTKKWKTGFFPYPDILYRRGGINKNNRKNYRVFIRQCKQRDTKFINPSSLGNWDIYNYFSSVESLQPYLLQTILYDHPEDLYYMVRKHKTIYLKGVTGRKGQKVVRVEKLSPKKFRCKYYDHVTGRVYTKVYNSLAEMIPFIEKFYKGKRFMIQEAIDLLEVKKRRIDLRAELQRSENGVIHISGISARMSQRNSPITIHSQAFPLDELFEVIKIPAAERPKLNEMIEQFLYTVYKETERKYGNFAEIGIDFALNKDLEIKFIECNSQSAKVSLMKAYGRKTLHRAMLNILLYSKYLIGKNKVEKEPREVEEREGALTF